MIYFDNAATSFPKPRTVTRAQREAMESYCANPGRSAHALSMKAAAAVYACRERLGSMLDVAPENITFTYNATYALNIVLKGVLRPGDHVVTSCLEHNSVMRPLYDMSRVGVRFSIAGVDFEDEERTVRNFMALVESSTRAVVMTQASNVCGYVLPVGKIAAAARERGLITIVDASQSLGMVDVQLPRDGIDYLCAPGHKGLYGPQGTGIVAAFREGELATLIQGGTGTNSNEIVQPPDLPERLEAGTLNVPGIAALSEGAAFVMREGGGIRRRERQLSAALWSGLGKIPGALLYGPKDRSGCVPVFSFNLRGKSPDMVARLLDEAGICVRAGLHCSPVAHEYLGSAGTGSVRASLGAFNTMEEVERFIAVLRRINSRA